MDREDLATDQVQQFGLQEMLRRDEQAAKENLERVQRSAELAEATRKQRKAEQQLQQARRQHLEARREEKWQMRLRRDAAKKAHPYLFAIKKIALVLVIGVAIALVGFYLTAQQSSVLQ